MGEHILFIGMAIVGIVIAISGPMILRLPGGSTVDTVVRTAASESMAGILLSISASNLGLLSVFVSHIIGVIALLVLFCTLAWGQVMKMRRPLTDR